MKRWNSPTVWLWQTGNVVSDSRVQSNITFSCWNKNNNSGEWELEDSFPFPLRLKSNSSSKSYLIFLCGVFTPRSHLLLAEYVLKSHTQVTLSEGTCTKCSVSMFFSLQPHVYMFADMQLIDNVSVVPLLYTSLRKGLLNILVSSYHGETIST